MLMKDAPVIIPTPMQDQFYIYIPLSQNELSNVFAYTLRSEISIVARETLITREMQSINGVSIRVLDSSFERIAFKTFES